MTEPLAPDPTPPLVPPAPAVSEPAPSEPAPSRPAAAAAPAATWPRLEDRATALGHEAEAAIERLGEHPAVREVALTATRLWGLLFVAIGAWLFADVTLQMDLPTIAWRELWPIALIVLGGVVVVRGLGRRR